MMSFDVLIIFYIRALKSNNFIPNFYKLYTIFLKDFQ